MPALETFKVSLVPGGLPVGEAEAWLLEGDDPNRWFAELATWNRPLHNLKVCLVPRPGARTEPAGLLVLSDRPAAERTDPRCHPLRRLGDKLYLPLHAEVLPAIDAAEANQAVRTHLGLLHPVYGLVLFEEADFIPVHQLIATPDVSRIRWNRGVPGNALAAHLQQITVPVPPDIEQFIESGRDDIGSEPMLDLPEGEGEPSDSALAKGGRWLGARFASGLLRLTELAPTGASEPTWIDGVQVWAANQLGKLNQVDQIARNKEIHRLLNMLKNNPEQGLKFAIPFGGEAGRGLAPPGHRLSQRPLDFSLGQGGDGGPVDHWEIPWEQQQQLHEKYRELAVRELEMGRYRRAAYIFASLLDDLHAAADALTQGGHYREAAALYKNKLNNPQLAAECLRKGGLLHESIELYLELGMHETCGDLYRELDEETEAELQYRTAIEKSEEQRAYLEVMRVLTDKLDCSEEALTVIDRAWPNSGDGVPCLMRHFDLLGELGRHEASEDLVRAICEQDAQGAETARIIDVYTHVLSHYPADRVKHLASDTGKVHIGSQLQQTSGHLARELAVRVRCLSPEDKLLSRDARRFGRDREQLAPSSRVRGTPLHGGLQLVRRLTFKELNQVVAVVSDGYEFYAMGSNRDHWAVLRSDWEGQCRVVEWPDSTALSLHVKCVKLPDCLAILMDHLPVQSVGAVYSDEKPCPCGRPVWMKPNTVAGCEVPEVGFAGLAVTESGYELSLINRSGHLIQTREVISFMDLAPHDARMFAPEIVMMRGLYYILFGTLLVEFSHATGLKTFELAAPGRHLIASLPNTKPRLVVTFERGAQIFWVGEGSWTNTAFAQDLFEPRATFMRHGHLVLMDQSNGEIYDTNQQVLTFRHTMTSGFPGEFLDVMLAQGINEFAEVSRDGKVMIWREPEG